MKYSGYIAEGSYLIPNEQMFEDITVSQKFDELLEVRSSYSFIYKHKDVMEVYIIGCKKNLAYENAFSLIELFRNVFMRHIKLDKEKFIFMDLFEIAGVLIYEKNEFYINLELHNSLTKNLLSITDLSAEDKAFTMEFVHSESNKEIADKLNLTERSIYNRLKKIRDCLSVDSKQDLKQYFRLNLIV